MPQILPTCAHLCYPLLCPFWGRAGASQQTFHRGLDSGPGPNPFMPLQSSWAAPTSIPSTGNILALLSQPWHRSVPGGVAKMLHVSTVLGSGTALWEAVCSSCKLAQLLGLPHQPRMQVAQRGAQPIWPSPPFLGCTSQAAKLTGYRSESGPVSQME